jgi:hypothetical protein
MIPNSYRRSSCHGKEGWKLVYTKCGDTRSGIEIHG